MRHGKRGRHLNRNAAHRRSLFRNLSRALITHEKIVTTLPKAKELRPFVEKLITLAKRAHAAVAAAAGKGEAEEKKAKLVALHCRRQAMAELGPTHGTAIWDKKEELVEDPLSTKKSADTVLKKLFRELGPRFADRPGGYTRILKQHYRRLGDGGTTAVVELLKKGEKKVQTKVRQPVAPAPAPIAPAPVTTAPATGETPAAN
ncbi:50S ribosomal protein L17 [Frigoriglobus tundricola]|uniref:Large ribosomal subunit protein bL17 n=1 Tax=Frigoriglobus tundricola TaxID=2774151 RepID=A0A6M5YU21_9BACT|nr:50S ribosomal protein L17 [Frigoriglobus tundricola]QJW96422.1 LSU ribosomal protein L17p [Frigoriglobus tundricola]